MIKEEKIQENAKEFLKTKNIYPFSVYYSTGAGISKGILSITLYIDTDLDEILDLLDYKSQCDKSGYLILKKDNTILLCGMALLNFLKKI